MKTASPIISELQNKKLAQTSTEFINGVDFNYLGNTPEGFVLDGTEAVKNKVLFWLSSAKGDYPREPLKGGILYDLLGRSFTQDNASSIETDIKTFFANHFAQELTLARVKVNPNKSAKRWEITLTVFDPIRRDLFTTSVGVSL
jgi:hypothetical protein